MTRADIAAIRRHNEHLRAIIRAEVALTAAAYGFAVPESRSGRMNACTYDTMSYMTRYRVRNDEATPEGGDK